MISFDYLLPGTIVLLKFLLRLTVDQEINGPDAVKAFLAFPVDIAFLSLTYGSAILYVAQNQQNVHLPVKEVINLSLVAIVLLIPVIVLAKKSERCLVLDKPGKALFLAAVGYALAAIITTVSVNVGGLI